MEHRKGIEEMFRKLYLLFIYLSYKKKRSNALINDLFELMKCLNLSVMTKAIVLEKYKSHWVCIYENLYKLLSKEDKDTFCRFILKKFYGIQTITEEEKYKIDNAFESVDKCSRFISNEKIYDFNFRGEKICFTIPQRTYSNTSELEIRLMKHYEIAHAFFLVEYEKNGFNPKNGDTILDCGAADGDTAVLFGKLYPNSKIYSFEFENQQYEYLMKNTRDNHVDNVSAIKTFLYKDTGNYWLSPEYKIKSQEKNGYRKVETMSIDDYVEQNNIDNIGLIKMDLEGGEIGALQGAVKTIKAQKPILYIPIYHLESDIYTIPLFVSQLGMKKKISIKWTEKLVWGVDCVLFVKFV